MQMIQLVSFGCGIDAITTDELRRILEGGNKLLYYGNYILSIVIADILLVLIIFFINEIIS